MTIGVGTPGDIFVVEDILAVDVVDVDVDVVDVDADVDVVDVDVVDVDVDVEVVDVDSVGLPSEDSDVFVDPVPAVAPVVAVPKEEWFPLSLTPRANKYTPTPTPVSSRAKRTAIRPREGADDAIGAVPRFEFPHFRQLVDSGVSWLPH